MYTKDSYVGVNDLGPQDREPLRIEIYLQPEAVRDNEPRS
jgi:hypothetical protein